MKKLQRILFSAFSLSLLASSQTTNVSRSVESDSQGRYTVVDLAPGRVLLNLSFSRNPEVKITGASPGVITSAMESRRMQVALKYLF